MNSAILFQNNAAYYELNILSDKIIYHITISYYIIYHRRIIYQINCLTLNLTLLVKLAFANMKKRMADV